MHSACTTVESRATTGAVCAVTDRATAVQLDSAPANSLDDRWFSRIARALFPVKAGMALHLATATDERSCHRYAAGERIPSATLFAELLCGDGGISWLRALLDQRNPAWWQDVKEGLALLEAVRRVQAERQQERQR